MKSITGVLVAGGILLAVLAFGPGSPAQPPRPGGLPNFPNLPPLPGMGETPGRFTVVKATDVNQILLLDTATGDLFKASIDDARPYKDRPKIGAAGQNPPPMPPMIPMPPILGKEPPRDKDDPK